MKSCTLSKAFIVGVLATLGCTKRSYNSSSPTSATDVASTVTTVADFTSANIGILKVVPGGIFQRDSTKTNLSMVSTFRMSEKEITRAQFAAVTGLADPSAKEYSTGTSDPVQNVNWYHALVFCNRLSMLEGLTPVYTINGSTDPANWGNVPTGREKPAWDAVLSNWSASGYRLPTEMEWMWAAMGGKDNGTGYLKAFAGSTGKNEVADYAWTKENSGLKTRPAGTSLPNELGLYDMSGNVWEWNWDWNSSHPTGSLNDYRGASSSDSRVTHGGGWLEHASTAAIANRNPGYPALQLNVVGFRVVLR